MCSRSVPSRTELLTGRRPSGTGDQIGGLTDEDVGKHAETIRAAVARAMHDEPARRYPSALAFASALEAAARGKRVADTVAVSAAAPVAAASGVSGAAAPTPPDNEADEPFPEEADILAERDEDTAHHDLLRSEEIDDAADTMLLDDEAVADLALDTPEEFNNGELDRPSAAALSAASWKDDRDADSARTAAESGELPSYRSVDRPGASASMDAEAHNTIVLERPRPAMLPMALMLILGLLLGFAAGYTTAERGSVADDQAAVTPANSTTVPPASPVPAVPDPAASGQAVSGQERPPGSQAQRSGRAYSEQVVGQPPVASPPIPGDAPPTGSARRSSPSAPPSSGAAAAGAGQMVVSSIPSRAGVMVNGDWRGRTPLTLSGLKFGTYNVRIVQPGFATAREDVTLSAAAPSRSLSVRLERAVGAAPSATARGAEPAPTGRSAAPAPLVGSIYVDSRPRGARVVLDGRPVGTTPTRIPDVPIGSHVVRLELPDHRLWSVSTRVTAGKETPVTGSLDPIR